ncbi:hypothetical protein [Nocardiopsis sp. NRRL B-16309]|uniref:hypothetical protein n=1 Tax=Nocardiopsis sp. NRRL B-16309 TaxID=1519494 RepID=UPI0012E17B4D|nr:hypothetical protein [Nocardiopsis sp. NRRL B-16309]
MSEIVADLGRPDLCLVALHHDSHEAYLGDIPSPLKRRLRDMGQFDGYTELVFSVDRAIGEAFEIQLPMNKSDEDVVKLADRTAFQMEAKLLLPNEGRAAIRDDSREILGGLPPCPEPLPPRSAASKFIEIHRSLDIL